MKFIFEVAHSPHFKQLSTKKCFYYSGKSVDEAGENEISISWVSPNPVSKRFKAKNDDVECIYAFNNKAISGVPITGVNAGRKTVLRKTLVDVHEQLQSLLEMAENEEILVQGTCNLCG